MKLSSYSCVDHDVNRELYDDGGGGGEDNDGGNGGDYGGDDDDGGDGNDGGYCIGGNDGGGDDGNDGGDGYRCPLSRKLQRQWNWLSSNRRCH